MRNGIRWFATIALGLFVLIGCGGGGGATGSAGGTAASPSAAPAIASSPTPEPPSVGGGTVSDVCGLVTTDELAKIFGVPSVTTTVFKGPPDTCSVDSNDGDPLVAWSFSATNAKLVFDAFVSDPESIEVSGIGDKAAFVQNTGLLVLKGDAMMVIGLTSGVEALSEEARNELAKQIGTLAAGRM